MSYLTWPCTYKIIHPLFHGRNIFFCRKRESNIQVLIGCILQFVNNCCRTFKQKFNKIESNIEFVHFVLVSCNSTNYLGMPFIIKFKYHTWNLIPASVPNNGSHNKANKSVYGSLISIAQARICMHAWILIISEIKYSSRLKIK